jgi:hypothetical protein
MTRTTVYLILSTVIGLHLFAPVTSGQTPSSAPSTEGWRFQLTPYLWGSGFNGRVGIGDRQAAVDASFSDLVEELDFGFMGVFEARRNRLVTATDLVYFNLSTEEATPGPLFSSVNATQKTLVVNPGAGYRIAGSDAAFVDVIGGIRFWRLKTELELRPGVLPGADREAKRDWVDGVFAVRGKWKLSPAWYISGKGDIGGGGSNLTYQFFGVAGASIADKVDIAFGYRRLNVNYNKDNVLFDTKMEGPVVGVVFKF